MVANSVPQHLPVAQGDGKYPWIWEQAAVDSGSRE